MKPFTLPVRQAIKEAIRLCHIAKETRNHHMRQSTRMFIRQNWKKRNTGVFIELKSSL